MVTVWAVFAEAVYRHECAGVFSTKEAAESVARVMSSASDGHHDYNVYEYTMDAPAVFDVSKRFDGSGIAEADAVASFARPLVRRRGGA